MRHTWLLQHKSTAQKSKKQDSRPTDKHQRTLTDSSQHTRPSLSQPTDSTRPSLISHWMTAAAESSTARAHKQICPWLHVIASRSKHAAKPSSTQSNSCCSNAQTTYPLGSHSTDKTGRAWPCTQASLHWPWTSHQGEPSFRLSWAQYLWGSILHVFGVNYSSL